MSWQPPEGDPPPDGAAPDAANPPDPASQPPGPPPVEPDTETARVPWEAAAAAGMPPPAQPAQPAQWTPPSQQAQPAPPPAPPLEPPPVVPPEAPAPAAPAGGSVLWASPTAAVTEIPGAPGLTFADTGARFIAWLIDIIIIGIVASIIAGALGYGRATSTGVAPSAALLSVPYALLGLVYFVGFWSGGRRATIGQRLFGIQVGNAFDGAPLTLEQAVRRWLGYGSFLGLFAVVPGIGPFAAVVEFVWNIVLLITTAQSPTKQGLHDRFANTALVRPVGQSSRGVVTACLVIIAVLVLLFVFSIVALIFLGSQVSGILNVPGA